MGISDWSADVCSSVLRLYGKTGSGGSSIASGRRLHAEEEGDAGDHGDGDGSQADGEAEQGDDAVTLGEADAGDEEGEGGNEAAQGDRKEEREGHEEEESAQQPPAVPLEQPREARPDEALQRPQQPPHDEDPEVETAPRH